MTHIPCGQDGWGRLTAVIDCHDREVIGYEFALRGRAKEAVRAIEAACLARFGTLCPRGATPMLRSDNGLIFQSLKRVSKIVLSLQESYHLLQKVGQCL